MPLPNGCFVTWIRGFSTGLIGMLRSNEASRKQFDVNARV